MNVVITADPLLCNDNYGLKRQIMYSKPSLSLGQLGRKY